MNQLKGNIETITVSGSLSLVKVRVGAVVLSSIVIDTPKTASYLRQGASVSALFKATEVVIATDAGAPVSLQNKIAGTVVSINRGRLLSEITLATEVGEITSIITTNEADALNLQPSSKAVAMIKTNEIMLAAC